MTFRKDYCSKQIFWNLVYDIVTYLFCMHLRHVFPCLDAQLLSLQHVSMNRTRLRHQMDHFLWRKRKVIDICNCLLRLPYLKIIPDIYIYIYTNTCFFWHRARIGDKYQGRQYSDFQHHLVFWFDTEIICYKIFQTCYPDEMCKLK